MEDREGCFEGFEEYGVSVIKASFAEWFSCFLRLPS